jgi:hypothetical protein
MPYDTLSEFLVKAPLYRAEAFPSLKAKTINYSHGGSTSLIERPALLDRECGQCGLSKWEYQEGAYEGRISEKSLTELTYKCRNCTNEVFNVWVIWWRPGGVTTFLKAGQLPKLEVSIPKEFKKALGDKRPLYVKGMTLRHNNYGIGALTYFRRLIEDTTNEMLDLLEEAMKETGSDPAAVEELERAKAGQVFEDKVKLAAKVLPDHLRPGGINPFGDLYDLLSIGLHGLTDEECCDIVDGMDGSLKFIYTSLKTHAEEARGYVEATREINAKVAGLKGRRRS